MRFSVAQKSTVLKWAKDLGAQEVPKLYALETLQKELNENMGVPKKEKMSRRGNIYFINDIGAAVAKVYYWLCAHKLDLNSELTLGRF